MRYRFAILTLIAVVPLMNLLDALAAPTPEPYAILDIGSPPKGETAEAYRQMQIDAQTLSSTLCGAWSAEVRKLPSVASMKDARPWLAENIRVKATGGGRHLCFTFRAGTREEQVTIINAFLRDNVAAAENAIKRDQEWIRIYEKMILENEVRIRNIMAPQEVANLQRGIYKLRTDLIPARRDNIAHWKEIAVIKWAK